MTTSGPWVHPGNAHAFRVNAASLTHVTEPCRISHSRNTSHTPAHRPLGTPLGREGYPCLRFQVEKVAEGITTVGPGFLRSVGVGAHALPCPNLCSGTTSCDIAAQSGLSVSDKGPVGSLGFQSCSQIPSQPPGEATCEVSDHQHFHSILQRIRYLLISDVLVLFPTFLFFMFVTFHPSVVVSIQYYISFRYII